MKYTEEQNKVINTRNRNLLVSAAAGSGKTAVLVERIIKMITDLERPIDIDKLLVVTFTNAAAAEMRERIGEALEKKIEETPDNKYLHRQITLISNANIMTIHAFCLSVIKNYFNLINIDPSFRIGDEIELSLLKNDIIKDLLEDKYEGCDESFINLIESFSGGKTDDMIETLILNLYKFSISNPWPEKWLDEKVESLNIKNKQELIEGSYYNLLITHLKDKLPYLLKVLEEVNELCLLDEGPTPYLEVVQSYMQQIIEIETALEYGYDKIYEAINGFSPLRLSSKRKGIDPILKERAKSLITLVKDEISDLRNKYFIYKSHELITDIHGTYDTVKVLVSLVKDFTLMYQQIKEEKNIIDFNDIEHFALNILIDQESGEPTSAADEYMAHFEEILIDEYQDSNLVQETILKAVAKERINQPNVFRVGDVKQSIYKFRLAKPELFMEKYDSYTEEDSQYQLINLHKNFRSRLEVLETTNFLFNQLMSKKLGDVIYDDKARLNLGLNYNEFPEINHDTEILIIDRDTEEAIDLTEKQLEARAIGAKIYKLINSDYLIYDKKNDSYRKVKYSDIVILLRTTSGWSDVFIEELSNMSIPVYSDTTTGYFETLEVSTIMNLLKLIDNPRQDIPLASVLRSPIVGLNGEELVSIRKSFEKGEYYTAVCQYVEGSMEENILSAKLKKFLNQLNNWRQMAIYTPIDELLNIIYEETNYYYYATLLPRGVQRQANLDLFIDKAVAYEKSSYRGLFNFIRYMENIQKYSIDLGEASIFSENDDLVKIMSIHKSKGLEFPVVFIAGMGKMFNMQDLKQSVVLHQDLGIGADYVNHEERYRVSTLPKNIIIDRLKAELLSEELRILYVALTRAREKIVMVATIKNIEKKAIKWCESLYEKNISISYEYLEKVTSFIDWVMPAVVRHPDGKVIRDIIDTDLNGPIDFMDMLIGFKIHLANVDDIIGDGCLNLQQEQDAIHDILSHWKHEEDDSENDLFELLDWNYNYKELVYSKVNMSVSDIKRMHMESDFEEFQKASIKPKFISEEIAITPAERGTAFHKVMYYIKLDLEPKIEIVNNFLDELLVQHIINQKERDSIYARAIVNFLKSPLRDRMLVANNTLKRETPFVIGVPVKDLHKEIEMDINEHIMVQGVIDSFFEEDGALVLVDYKTDYLKDGEEELLIKRYKEQMDYYKMALERIMGKQVKEIILYSLSLSKEISVKENER